MTSSQFDPGSTSKILNLSLLQFNERSRFENLGFNMIIFKCWISNFHQFHKHICSLLQSFRSFINSKSIAYIFSCLQFHVSNFDQVHTIGCSHMLGYSHILVVLTCSFELHMIDELQSLDDLIYVIFFICLYTLSLSLSDFPFQLSFRVKV